MSKGQQEYTHYDNSWEFREENYGYRDPTEADTARWGDDATRIVVEYQPDGSDRTVGVMYHGVHGPIVPEGK